MFRPLVALMTFAIVAAPSTGAASISIAGEYISADAVALFKARWQRVLYLGLIDQRFDFYRPSVFLGITARPMPSVAVRCKCDVSGQGNVSVADLYADLRFFEAVSLRIGQFAPVPALESGVEVYEIGVGSYSYLARYWKPWDQRDVGLMLSVQPNGLLLQLAAVNGSGTGQGLEDNNRWKDVAGRATLSVASDSLVSLTAKLYYGRFDEGGAAFLSSSAGGRLKLRGAAVTSEWQYADKSGLRRLSAYVLGTLRVASGFQVSARLQGERELEDSYDLGGAFALTWTPPRIPVETRLIYDIRDKDSRQYDKQVTEHKIICEVVGWI